LFAAALFTSLISCRRALADPEACGPDSPEVGYTSIAAMNQDMEEELAAIESGGVQPQDMYTYNLCPNTVFDATDGPLRPVLNNAFFLCGTDGSSSNTCVITGGSNQILIEDSTVSTYPLESLTFMGIEFQDFTSESISASASSSATTAYFKDVLWTGFRSGFVVNQATFDEEASSGAIMTVDISDSTVSAGTTGSAFDNNGGTLRITNLIVTEVDAAALIATANGGNSFLQESAVTSSGFDTVTTTSSTGTQTVMNVQINQMRRLGDGDGALVVADTGSQLNVMGTTISDNDLAGTRWRAVTAKSGATATVTNSAIANNEGLEFAVSSIGSGSSLTIRDSSIRDNTGTVRLRLHDIPQF